MIGRFLVFRDNLLYIIGTGVMIEYNSAVNWSPEWETLRNAFLLAWVLISEYPHAEKRVESNVNQMLSLYCLVAIKSYFASFFTQF